MQVSLEEATSKLLAYCRTREWAGYDPYDALNSRVFTTVPFLNSRVPRIVLTQALKRSPVNIRRLVLIPKTQNPKAVALFLSAALKLSRAGVCGTETLPEELLERLIDLRSPDMPHWAWGYSFPWQTRALVVPRGAPNLVCTSFVGTALLDMYEMRRDSRCLEMAASAAQFMLDELYWTEGNWIAGFSYPLPSVRVQIHNANLLGAALLARVYKHTGDKKLLAAALRVARCAASQQHDDGSWDYGDASNQRWIDNFHTGYNLCALRSIGESLQTTEFEPCLRRGFEFYRAHFFREDGAARYFHNETYPIDIHCIAQSIITLVTLNDLDPQSIDQARSVLRWAVDHLWDRRGFFYYRMLRLCIIRTSYMRWSQAWMLLAMSTLLSESEAAASRTVLQGRAPLAQAC